MTDAAATTDAFLPLPDLHFHILLALAEGDAHGWIVIKRIRALAQRRSAPSSGSLYLAMIRLEERGLIAESAAAGEEADGRRRSYALTDLGRAVMRAEASRLAALVAAAGRVDAGGVALRAHEGSVR